MVDDNVYFFSICLLAAWASLRVGWSVPWLLLRGRSICRGRSVAVRKVCLCRGKYVCVEEGLSV